MIPLYRPPSAGTLRRCLAEAVDSSWWGYGPRCGAVERRFTEFHGGSAVALNSGTAALFTAARLLQPQPGDEVIVPAMTYISTAMAFHEAGFTIKLADVDATTLLLTTETVSPLISRRTRAVVAVHLYGQRAPTDSLAKMCTDVGVVLVEDRAHRIGLSDPPRGDFACYSFNVLKEAPAGDGGLLWYRDVGLNERARSLSNVGLSSDTWERTRESRHGAYTFDGSSGLKLRLNDLAASFVLAGLDSLQDWQARRRTIFLAYDNLCRRFGSGFRMRQLSEDDSCLMAVLRTCGETRNDVRESLRRAGIATSIHYPSLSHHPLFSDSRCPNADTAAKQVLTLPLFPDLPDESVDDIMAALTAAEATTRNNRGIDA